MAGRDERELTAADLLAGMRLGGAQRDLELASEAVQRGLLAGVDEIALAALLARLADAAVAHEVALTALFAGLGVHVPAGGTVAS